MSKRSTADGVSFDRLCVALGVPRPLPEYQFAAVIGRQWRFDWAWPSHLLALEIDGGGFVGRGTDNVRGHHHHPVGYANDCIKLANAVLLGWRVLRFTPQQVQNGTAIDFVRRALAHRVTS